MHPLFGDFSDNGAINEVKVYSRALTDLEIKKILIALGVFAVESHDKLAVTWGTIQKVNDYFAEQ